MNDLTLSLPDGGQVRKTADGKASVYDLLKLAGAKSPAEVFKRLSEAYPDSVTKCDFIKFARVDGKLQAKATPVTDIAGWRRILTVLPGMLGKHYRAVINEMADQFFDDPETLNTRTLERIEDPAALKRVELRARTKRTNKGVNGQIFSRGGSQSTAKSVANMNNLAVTGHVASDLKAMRGVKETREGFTDLELATMAFAEELEITAMQAGEVFGHDEIIRTVQDVTRDVSAIRRKHTGALPYPRGGLLPTSI